MRDFQNAYPNDHYIEFDRQLACWSYNHNGWRKAKKKWRRIGKKRIKRQIRKMVEGELLEREVEGSEGMYSVNTYHQSD